MNLTPEQLQAMSLFAQQPALLNTIKDFIVDGLSEKYREAIDADPTIDEDGKEQILEVIGKGRGFLDKMLADVLKAMAEAGAPGGDGAP